jgi:hypothetical protein
MKSRKGFCKIDINGKKFLFNWANNPDGPMLVMYYKNDRKIEIPFHIWVKYPDSEEYSKRETDVWHGKHKRGPEWGCWGKREAREMYFKYLKHIEECFDLSFYNFRGKVNV